MQCRFCSVVDPLELMLVMPELFELKTFVLCGFLVVAVFGDMRFHRIPNRLCVYTIVTGILLQVIVNGTGGLMVGVGGLLTGFLVLLPFYFVGGMGAGDVKLMASVGTFLGVSGAFVAGAVTLVVGAVIGCGVVVLKQFRTWDAANDVVEVQSNVWKLEFPYAAAIAVGTVAALIFESPLFPFNR